MIAEMANPETQQQTVPKLESPVVDASGAVALPWYRFFTYIWQVASGSGQAMPANSVLLQQTGTPGLIVVTDSSSGTILGHITLDP